jgi:four helix bundle protein
VKRETLKDADREIEMKIKNFRDLDIWKLGMETVIDIYKITSKFPKEETYGLTGQMRRAVISIPSNIAEGFNRYHNKEYRQYLYIALGSCGELETQIEASYLLQYIDQTIKDAVLEKIDHESRMLRNVIKRL